MLDSEVEATIQAKYEQLAPYFNETSIRMWAAVEALSLGHGGITSVSRATGLSRTTIHAGITELEQSESEEFDVEAYGAVCRRGSGRKPYPTLLEDLKRLVSPDIRRDSESPLRWTTKSTTKLAKELQTRRYRVSQRTVCCLLWELGYSL